MDFWTVRSQRVSINGILSDVLFSSTGHPERCVLSPLLFVLYTNECQSQHPGRHIIKFADDSVIMSLRWPWSCLSRFWLHWLVDIIFPHYQCVQDRRDGDRFKEKTSHLVTCGHQRPGCWGPGQLQISWHHYWWQTELWFACWCSSGARLLVPFSLQLL